jgi:dihydropteroate synthase
MGIVNVTPDSFAGDGVNTTPRAAIAQAYRFVDDGADLIDIGGESTRPGAAYVPDDEEIARVLPVVEGLLHIGVPLSVDTRKPAVMRAVLAAGADMINDVAGFADPASIAAIAQSAAALCVMHMQGEPATMQRSPVYRDVVADVRAWLQDRVMALRAAGVAVDRLVLDPGIGFGKTIEHNLALLRGLHALADDGLPILVGLSRKSLVGALTGRAVGDRMAGSVAGALAAVARGASILRVHDVAATCDALKVWLAIAGEPRMRTGCDDDTSEPMASVAR